MEQAWIYSIQDLRWRRMNFGGEFVFKGFPTANRDGNAFQINSSLAITSNSNNKEGAWEFIRTMLTKDWQLDSVWGFPTNKAAFYTLVEEAMTEPEYPDIWYIGGEEVVMGAVTQEQVDQVIELIESVNNIASWDTALMNIIMEGAQDFFSGRSTAQEAARVVQNRANIYISEQS
jgi:ABC-type glycerol-3-phosphate transport system substrate-binding protein